MDRATQNGIALISVLLVLALVTASAVAMTSKQQLDIRRTGNILNADQAYQYALGVEQWAMGVLVRDAQQDKANGQVDSLSEKWAEALPVTKVNDAKVYGVVRDAQASFNLNNLATSKNEDDKLRQIELFQRLLRSLEIDDKIAQSVADWIDHDEEARFPNGAEDSVYLARKKPYRTANSAMASVSELRLIEGVTEEMYQTLIPYLTTLPTHTTININTAPEPVLKALVENLPNIDITTIISERNRLPFTSKENFLQRIGLITQQDMAKQYDTFTTMIDVSSAYYLSRAQAQTGYALVHLTSTMRKDSQGKIQVIARYRDVE